jgi:DNA-binding CsgD family transcriptional regulator
MKSNLLTPCEREILVLVANGKTTSEVANILKIAKGAVDAHVKSAAQKLRALNRTHEHSKRAGNIKTIDKQEDKLRLVLVARRKDDLG